MGESTPSGAGAGVMCKQQKFPPQSIWGGQSTVNKLCIL